MNFYLDGWYASRIDEAFGMGAEDVAAAIRAMEGVVAAIVVRNVNKGWGVLYIADKPTADFHEAASWAVDGYLFSPATKTS